MKENNVLMQKIIYFDEDSITDYIQIVEGGSLEKTTELLNETNANLNGEAKASSTAGISGVFKAILGLESKIEANINLGASLNTNKIAKNILKNTILTDFIELLKKDESSIRKFKGYKISVEKDSLSYIIMVSPYMTMLGGKTGIQAGEFDILLDKIDNAVKSGKGYYEFLGTKENDQIILRFNIDAFKNNYKISDLLKMDLSIFAIKVGTTTLDKLNINNELNLENKEKDTKEEKDNPSYIENEVVEENDEKDESDKELDVYDVLLAGVEKND